MTTTFRILSWTFLLLLSPAIIAGSLAAIIVFSAAIGFKTTADVLYRWAEAL